MFGIDVETHGRWLICQPAGELDAYTAPHLRAITGRLSDLDRVVLDLSEVRFIDSAGLGALIAVVRCVRDRGGDVTVCCPTGNVRRVLDMAGFGHVARLSDDVSSAIGEHDGVRASSAP